MKTCPYCNTENYDTVDKCSCGYYFNQELYHKQSIEKDKKILKVKNGKFFSKIFQNKTFNLILTIFVAALISAIYRDLTRDKNAKSSAEFQHYCFFESTFNIQSPFELREESVNLMGQELYEKASMAVYKSKNVIFLINALKIKPIYSGNIVEKFDEGSISFLKNMGEQLKCSYEIERKGNKTINNLVFTEYVGVLTPLYSDAINQKLAYNFKILHFLNAKYYYIICLMENIHRSDINVLENKIFNSIEIVAN